MAQIRRLWVKELLIFVIAVFGLVAVARALPTVGGEVEFYSDNTFSTQVGYWYWPCGAQQYRWGTETSYMLVLDWYSCEGGGSNQCTQVCWDFWARKLICCG